MAGLINIIEPEYQDKLPITILKESWVSFTFVLEYIFLQQSFDNCQVVAKNVLKISKKFI